MREKHQVNVKKNSVVNFQIGLIATLTFVYVMFEVFTTAVVIANPRGLPSHGDSEITHEIKFKVVPNNPPKKEVARVAPRNQRVVILDEIKKVDDNTVEKPEVPIETPKVDAPSAPVDKGLEVVDSGEVKTSVPSRSNEPSYVNAVEFAPVFPGCERLKTNNERVSCFQKKIQRMVSRKFNGSLGEDLGLQGVQRIHVMFEIDSYGQVKNVKARAAHPKLQKEAIRVTKQLPKMIPAKQGKNNVAVQYALPIIFDVRQ